jgi:hypothetical protein
MNTAQIALDESPFLDMADRYKVLTPADAASAETMADDLSELREQGLIQAFHQLFVQNQQVFTVACY